jgi:thiamine-phosphate pyrophosphorylase
LLPRFYPILDTELLARCAVSAQEAAEALLNAGARILQFRHKTDFDRQTFSTAERVAELCSRTNAIFVMNDRADIALMLDAALHIGQDDLAPADARKVIGESRTLGFSTHNERQLLASKDEPIDYVAIGPIFTTGSKRNPDLVVGIDELRRLRVLAGRPLVAIGGITRHNAIEVMDAGADSVAVVGDLIPQDPNPRTIRQRAEEWMSVLND